MTDDEKKNNELDIAIENKRRSLLAESVGSSVAKELQPHLNAISVLLGGLGEKDTQSEIIKKLSELNDTLKNHEITIEI